MVLPDEESAPVGLGELEDCPNEENMPSRIIQLRVSNFAKRTGVRPKK